MTQKNALGMLGEIEVANTSEYLGANILYSKKDVVKNLMVPKEVRLNLESHGVSPTPEEHIRDFFDYHSDVLSRNIMSESFSRMNNPMESSSAIMREVIQKVETDIFQKPRLNSDEVNLRLNDQGIFFQNQLQQVYPALWLNPTRGISFPVIPMLSIGAGMQQVLFQAYNWNASFVRTWDAPTQNVPGVTVSPYQITVPNYNFSGNITITFQQLFTMAQIANRAGSLGNMPFDSFVGSFGAIAALYEAQIKEYMLELDNIAWLGAESITALNNGDIPFTQIVDGTGDNGVPLLTLADVFPTTTPTDLLSMSPSQAAELVMTVVNNVALTSFGNFVANTLYIDNGSYLILQQKINEYKDTTARGFLEANNALQLMVPVAAWQEAYPNQCTMFALKSDAQVMFFNLSKGLSVTGVQVLSNATQTGYFFQTSGCSIMNSLGTTQFVCPIDDSFIMEDKKLNTSSENKMMASYKRKYNKLLDKKTRDDEVRRKVAEQQKMKSIPQK